MFKRRKFVFDDDAKQAFLEHIEETGLVAKSARLIGTTSRVVKAELRHDEVFKEAFEQANDLFLESLEEEIYRRGVTGIEEPVFFKGVQTDSKTVYSDQLLIFQTKANIEKYGDRSKQDVHITGGVLVAAAPAVSPEAWLEAQEAQNALPGTPANQLPEATKETDERIIDVQSTDPVPV